MMMIRLTLLACAIAHASAQKADKTSSPTAAKADKSLSLDAKAGKSMSLGAAPATSATEFGQAVDTREFVDSLVWVEDKETKVVGSTRKGALEAPTEYENAEVGVYLGGSNGVAAAGGKSAKAGKGASMGSISAKSQKGKAEKSGDAGFGNIMLDHGVLDGEYIYLNSEGEAEYDLTGGYGAGSMKTKSQKGTASAKAEKFPGAKSGKSDAKSGEYWLSPFNCPGDCITAQNYDLSEQLLEDAVATCDASDEYQAWKVHEQGEFVKFESANQYDANMCLSVVSEWAGDFSDADDLCSGGLGLVNCTLAMASWYFTGGQFLSAYCWRNGYSVALTVDKNCTELSVSSVADAMESGSSQTFMVLDQDFIQTITDYV